MSAVKQASLPAQSAPAAGAWADALWRRGLERVVYGLAGLALFILVWRLAYVLDWAPRGTLPDPLALPSALVAELESGRLWPAAQSSLVHYFWGLGLGTVLGILFGLASATLRRFDLLQAYLVRLLRPIPPLAWVVFAIAWFKVSHAGAAFVIAIGVFWLNYFATYSAVRSVDPRYYELASAFGHGSYFSRAWTVTLPAIAPGLLSGVRAGIGQAWMTLIAAELLGVPGMGQEMNAAAGVGAYDAVVVYMLIISMVYTVCDMLFLTLNKWILQWQP
ncbi:ABC transporter permease [Alcaligenes aquatilis]|uniref:ABC transporter permease n=1 Tax=Alcaligenes aquatilis TaxID=323284 RepID=A0A3G2HZC0_9BURK|nr:ABC transporter permease [Alcaligenes aquatilis]AYN22211.1 ABC transporter permease [Alcaligenes aquatilis]